MVTVIDTLFEGRVRERCRRGERGDTCFWSKPRKVTIIQFREGIPTFESKT